MYLDIIYNVVQANPKKVMPAAAFIYQLDKRLPRVEKIPKLFSKSRQLVFYVLIFFAKLILIAQKQA